MWGPREPERLNRWSHHHQHWERAREEQVSRDLLGLNVSGWAQWSEHRDLGQARGQRAQEGDGA